MKIYIKSDTDIKNNTVTEIQKVLDLQDYNYYGLRIDDYDYNIGDICYNSHNLFEDPDYDYDDNLIYPYCDSGPYEGFYDGGELDGTCAIGIWNDNISMALRRTKNYFGSHLYLIGSDYAEDGNDPDELIMEDAEVLIQLY